MSAIRNIRMLTRYNAWASARLFVALADLLCQAAARPPTMDLPVFLRDGALPV